MFKNLLTFFVLLFCIMAAGGCGSKDSDTGTNPTQQGDYLRATIEGQIRNSTVTGATTGTQLGQQVLAVTARVKAGSVEDSLAIFLGNVTGPGTYAITSPSTSSIQLRSGGTTWTTGLKPGETYGEVVITKLANGRVTGTFHASLVHYTDVLANTGPRKEITGGSFDMAVTQ